MSGAMVDTARVRAAWEAARRQLLAARTAEGHWEGRLSSSALATATAAYALWRLDGQRYGKLVRGGLAWLAAHVNEDGGWGDTVRSGSNISTTVLAWAALRGAGAGAERYGGLVAAAESWLAARAGGLDGETLAGAIAGRYGEDKTFSAPILTMAALAGVLGPEREAWGRVEALPFELAGLGQRWLRWLGLPVVSYALPALIAIGQVREWHRPEEGWARRWLRRRLWRRTERLLERIQPASGGFLEAAPLTSFVVMSLAGSGRAEHVVARRGAAFLAATVREDGSWPIDTNLATWVTTLAVGALTKCRTQNEKWGIEEPPTYVGGFNRGQEAHVTGENHGRGAHATTKDAGKMPATQEAEWERVRGWLLGQQYRDVHPYTQARPGGWGWTDLSGAVPDGDDTAGALLALRALGAKDAETVEAARGGVGWLLDLQNRDGGLPTFCRGWGRLPFDRSGADLTAHALGAWAAWRQAMGAGMGRRIERATGRAVRYLRQVQREDGAWEALWFGNEAAVGEVNLTYGTGRVLLGLAAVETEAKCDKDAGKMDATRDEAAGVQNMMARGVAWLLAAQGEDGGWGGDVGVTASVEETAVAVEALAAVREGERLKEQDPKRKSDVSLRDEILTAGKMPATPEEAAVARGAAWLARRLAEGTVEARPIGLYFARLWYYEDLYPLVFSTAALGRVLHDA